MRQIGAKEKNQPSRSSHVGLFAHNPEFIRFWSDHIESLRRVRRGAIYTHTCILKDEGWTIYTDRNTHPNPHKSKLGNVFTVFTANECAWWSWQRWWWNDVPACACLHVHIWQRTVTASPTASHDSTLFLETRNLRGMQKVVAVSAWPMLTLASTSIGSWVSESDTLHYTYKW